MSDLGKEIGRLQSDADNSKSDIGKLFESNTKRKDENHTTLLLITKMNATVERTNDTVNGSANAMKELKKDIGEIKKSVAGVVDRVDTLEKKQVNWGKICRWASTFKGTVVIITVCFTIVTAILAKYAPEYILPFFDVVKAAKQ